jgi:enoyl-CoA hydratase/carnithine racemase
MSEISLTSPVPHVLLVTINRPEARNAVNVPVKDGIAKAVEESEANDEIWCVVLTGAGGKAFCAGADLKEIAAGRALSLRTEAGGFAGFTHVPRMKPWIAAVDGFALGGGCEIALACDLIVATEQSVFGLPEARRALIAAAGGVYRLPRVLPRNIALELIATGAELPAARAHHFGMVNRLAPPGKALETALVLAEAICVCAPVAVRESLTVARAAYDQDDATLRRLTLEAMQRNSQTEDYKEGPRAFVEKRPPKWVSR